MHQSSIVRVTQKNQKSMVQVCLTMVHIVTSRLPLRRPGHFPAFCNLLARSASSALWLPYTLKAFRNQHAIQLTQWLVNQQSSVF